MPLANLKLPFLSLCMLYSRILLHMCGSFMASINRSSLKKEKNVKNYKAADNKRTFIISTRAPQAGQNTPVAQ